MAKIVSLTIPTRAEIVYAQDSFDKAKEALETIGYKIASAEDIAKARIEQGKDAEVSRYGGWTKEEFVYDKSNGIYLSKNLSHIIANARKATECHRNGEEFYLTDKQVNESLDSGAILVSKDSDDFSISTNRFGEDKIMVYAFGESAKQYGEFLRKAGIKGMSVWLANLEDKPFARQMWFGFFRDWSFLVGNLRDLSYSSRVRGVRFSK